MKPKSIRGKVHGVGGLDLLPYSSSAVHDVFVGVSFSFGMSLTTQIYGSVSMLLLSICCQGPKRRTSVYKPERVWRGGRIKTLRIVQCVNVCVAKDEELSKIGV